jgi:cytochrome c peroxidase
MVGVKRRLMLSMALILGAGLAAQAAFDAVELQDSHGFKIEALPILPPAPADNLTTPEKAALGKQLFFDPRLSGDNTKSCASCHLPDKAFTDGLIKARGLDGKQLGRNTPGLLNVGFYTTYFWDGRAASLEEQAFIPIQSPVEMNQNLDELESELDAVAGYASQFRVVFGSRVTKANIARALAAFQRTLISRNAPLDRFLSGDKKALSEEAMRGFELFKGAAGCMRCHNGPMLSDNKFYRLGTALNDKGRGAVSGVERELHAFRTPALRDVARTAPYMHDGSFDSLFSVVEFYYRSAPGRSPDGLPLDIEPLLGQSYSEISDVVAFLESLNGEPIKITPPALP